MKKKISLIIVGLASFSIAVNAQQLERQVIASGGGGNSSTTFTIGEAIISSNTLSVVSGFQQPSFMGAVPLGITDITNDLNIFPVPTKNELTINGENFNGISTQLSLYSTDGRKVDVEIIRSEDKITIDLSSHPSGYYYITLLNEATQTIANFQILKQ